MMLLSPFTVIILLFCFVYFSSGLREGPYAHLLKFIQDVTSPDTIPVPTKGHPVDIEIVIYPKDIRDVDTISNTASIQTWLLLSWNSSVTWSPNEFDGVDEIAVPIAYIWVPEPVVEYGLHKLVNENPDYVMMHSNGVVKWTPGFTFQNLCEVNEDQLASKATCSIQFGTIASDNTIVKFINADDGTIAENGVDLKYYFPGSRYEILGASIEIGTFNYDCCLLHNFSKVTFTYDFKLRNAD